MLTTELDGLAIMSGYAFRHRSDYSMPWIGTPDQNCGGGLFIANFPGVNLQPVMVEVTIRDCTFENNYAEEEGGALYCLNVQTLRMIGCQFNGNGTHLWGGGLYLLDTAAEVVDCRFQGNHADIGGGIWFLGPETTFRGSIFTENVSTSGGGMYIGSNGTPQ